MISFSENKNESLLSELELRIHACPINRSVKVRAIYQFQELILSPTPTSALQLTRKLTKLFALVALGKVYVLS